MMPRANAFARDTRWSSLLAYSPTTRRPSAGSRKSADETVVMSICGSSPRVRGTHSDEDVFKHEVTPRFIPACAGNASQAELCHADGITAGSSPRVRGTPPAPERLSHRAHGGSSPRVRGTPPRRRFLDVGNRFIPACAGERAQKCSGNVRVFGSSPRVRGTLWSQAIRLTTLRSRFIPACAGNAISIAAPARRRARRFIPACAGNAEHRQRGSAIAEFRRFIPACAGNARLQSSPESATGVGGSSPRVRGTPGRAERRSLRAENGSSPRVRGTLRMPAPNKQRAIVRFIPACAGNAWLRPGQPWHLGRRFIPACAGNAETSGPPSEEQIGPVHPRVCGERRTRCPGGGRIRTLPVHPRVCGERCEVPDEGRRKFPRFIPACAGNACGGGRYWSSPRRRFIPACAGNARG